MLETAEVLPVDPPGVASSGGPVLLILGTAIQTVVPLEMEVPLVIGRDGSCDIPLVQPTLSRFHARVVWRSRAVIFEDLGSRNGMWFGGKRVQRAELSVGESIRLADLALTVMRAACEESHFVAAAPALAPGALYLSQEMLEVKALLHRLAATNLSVAIIGETGTGKELAVRELHLASPRKRGPLRVLNCAAIPANLVEATLFGHERGAFTGADRARPGVFEEAKGGTVFLDEVGELPENVQAALLRVLESQTCCRIGSTREIALDVRTVCATHRDLRAMVDEGAFRIDLYHRLCAAVVELPPLRERRSEIAPLARHFLGQEAPSRLLDDLALASLERYDWPGNVRELRNVLTCAAATAAGSAILESDLPARIRTYASVGDESIAGNPQADRRETLPMRLKQLEHEQVLDALRETGGNQRRAAAMLGMSLRTLERRVRNMRQASAK